MRLLNLVVTSLIFSCAVPVYACVKITPSVRMWTQCSYKAASKTQDHEFLVNYADAKWQNKKLLASAEPRWKKLEPRILAACGKYDLAAEKDRQTLNQLNKTGAYYVPENQFLAISDTGDIKKLVKY
jgi:hypothetical protein